MTGNNHLLQKVTFEIGLASQDGAFEIQNRISNAFQSGILRELERFFDSKITGDKVITIDKIEINLGHLNVARLEEELAIAFEKQMDDFFAAISEEISRHDSAPFGGSQKISIRWSTPSNPHFEAEVTVSGNSTSRYEKVIHLLQYGIVPGAGSEFEIQKLSVLIHEVLSEHPLEFTRFLRTGIRNSRIIQRLVFNLTPGQLQYIAANLGCSFSSELINIVEQVGQMVRISQSVRELRLPVGLVIPDVKQKLWWHILNYFAVETSERNGQSTPGAKPEILLILNLLSNIDVLISGEILPLVSPALTSPAPGPSVVKSLHLLATKISRGEISSDSGKKTLEKTIALLSGKRLKGITSSKMNPGKKNEITVFSGLESDNPSLPEINSDSTGIHDSTLTDDIGVKPVSHSPVSESTRKSASPGNFELADEIGDDTSFQDTSIYIRNAGLIILGPYLRHFFLRLGLLDAKVFASTEASWKAVHLLQYLTGLEIAEGETGWSEHDLAFNKIICGIEIHEPVPEQMELTDDEKAEANELLVSVLNNWTIMRRSSPYALQTTFLQKKGRLKKAGNDWELVIERDSAVEVLIDKLPWAISLMRLPWNEYTIHSQW